MAGLWGKLTKEKFGYTMPVTDPIIDEPPYYYRNAERMAFEFETDDEIAAQLLPEGLQLASSPARGTLVVAHYPYSTVGAYNEVVLVLHVLWEGEPHAYLVHIFVDSEVAMLGGREIYGTPKVLADIEIIKSEASITAYVEKPKGNRIISATMRPAKNLPKEQFGNAPIINLKVIPNVEKGKEDEPELAQLVRYTHNGTPVVGTDGTAEFYSGPGKISFDSGIHMLSNIPVNKIVNCTYGRIDSVLDWGKVIKKY